MTADMQFVAVAAAILVACFALFQLASVRLGENMFGLAPRFAKAVLLLNVAVVIVWLFVGVISRTGHGSAVVGVLFMFGWMAAVFSPIVVSAAALAQAIVVAELLLLKRWQGFAWHATSLIVACVFAIVLVFGEALSG